MMSPELSALLRRRDRPRALAVTLQAETLDSDGHGVPAPLYLSTVAGLVTEPEDEPAARPFSARILPGARWIRTVTDGPSFGGGARPFSFALDIDNRDGRLDPYLDPETHRVRGRPATVRLGGLFQVDGRVFPWSAFSDLGSAVVTEWGRSAGNRSRLRLVLSGFRALDDRPAVFTVWGGWGGGLHLDAGPGVRSWATAPDAAHLDLGSEFTVGWTGRIREEGEGNWRPMILKGSSVLDSHYGIALTSELVPAVLSRGAHVGTAPIPLDERLGFALRVRTDDGTATAELHIRRADGSFSRVVGPVAIPTPDPVTGPLEIGRWHAMQSLDLYEAWGISRALNDGEARQWLARPITADADEALRFLYKAEDRVGDVLADELGRSPMALVLAGASGWVSSLEGDDPTRFDTGTAGTTSGRVVGPCRSVRAHPVDTAGQWYRWSDLPSALPSAVISQGVPVVQDVDIDSAAIRIDADENALIGPPGAFSRLVPGQGDPVRAGQRIDITTTSGFNDGVFEIAAEGIDAHGSVCRLVEPLTATEPAGAAVRVRSQSPQVFVDSERSALTTAGGMGTPPGDLVVDVVGLPESLQTASAQYALWSGRDVVSTLAWDPVLAVALPAGPPTERAQILRRILDSAHAWARELPNGSVVLGNWPIPGESETVARLTRFQSPPRPLHTIPPYWNIAVGYGRVWHPFRTVAESVPAGERERLQTAFRWIDDQRPEIRDSYATAEELRLETYLPDLDAAWTLLNRLRGLHGVPRAFWELNPGPEVLAVAPPSPVEVVADGVFTGGRSLVATHIDVDPVGSSAVVRGYL